MSGLFMASLRLLKAIRGGYADPEFRALFLLMLLLLISGTIFYVSEESWSIVDALYFCIMIMSTIGHSELFTTSSVSKIFTILYSPIAIGVFIGAAAKLAQALLTPKQKLE